MALSLYFSKQMKLRMVVETLFIGEIGNKVLGIVLEEWYFTKKKSIFIMIISSPIMIILMGAYMLIEYRI